MYFLKEEKRAAKKAKKEAEKKREQEIEEAIRKERERVKEVRFIFLEIILLMSCDRYDWL